MPEKHSINKDQYKKLLHNLPDAVYHFIPPHRIVYANAAFLKLFNYPGHIAGNEFHPPFHPNDADIFDKIITSLTPENYPEKIKLRLQHNSNDIKWTEWSFYPILDHSGSLTEYQVVIEDVTDRKKTEHSLKQSEQLYKISFDQAADMIVIIDRMGNFLNVNYRFEIDSGWNKSEITGRNIFTSKLLTRESADRISSKLNRIISGEEIPPFEIQGITRSGSIVDYEIKVVPLVKDNVILSFQAILRNIKDRKVVLKALRESQRQLSNLMSNLPGMAYRCRYDENWTMEFVSEGSLQLTGYPPDALINNKIAAYGNLILPEDKQMVFKEVQNAVEKHLSFRVVYRLTTFDGHLKWVWEQGSGVYDENGAVEAVEGFISDITEQKQIQEALRENEELYKKLISALPDMIVITDINGNIMFMNDLGIKMSGYGNFEEIKHKNITGFIIDQDKDRALKNFKERLSKPIGSSQYTFVSKDGAETEFEVNGEPLRDKDNMPYGMMFSCRDISARKKAEAALAQSEQKYRTLIDSMQDGVFLVQNEKLDFVNEAFAELLGYDVEELLDMNISKIIAPEDVDRVMKNYRSRQAGEFVPASYEFSLLHKDGNRVHVIISVRIIDFHGKVASIGTIKDVTQRKVMEETLSRQKNILSGTAEASNILLVETDFNTAIHKTLKALGESAAVDRVYIFENGYDDQTGHYMSQKFEWANENVTPQIENQFLQHLNYHPDFNYWYDAFSKGNYIWSLVKDLPVEIRSIMEEEDILSILEVPIKIKDELWGFIGFDDCHSEREWSESEISILKAAAASIGGAIERERTNRELISAKNKAEEMNRLKSNFLANMSHELRTPLIGILGYAELLALETENEKWKSMLETIYSGGERLLDTLNHLLDLSKIEANMIKLNPEPVNIVELSNEVTDLFKTVASRKKIELKSKFSQTDIVIESDKRLLRSILNNLVSNAIKFTDSGSVSLEAQLVNSTEQSYILFKIIDSGIGISDESKEFIFEEFRQASEGFSRQFEGTGLGLTITKKFVELLNGKIELQSNTGKGVTFIVELPVSKTISETPEVPAKTEPETAPRPVVKQNIIIVDDDPASRSVITLFLRKEFNVAAAETGEEAYSMMQNNLYDLILLDISLGKGINGLDLIKLIRKNETYEKVPVMAVTAHAMVGDKEKFLNEGFNDYIAKPFSKHEFVSKINQLLLNYKS